MNLKIDIDKKKLIEVEVKLGNLKHKAPQAIYRSLNRAANTAKSTAGKEAKNKYYIKSTEVKETISVVKANRTRLGAEVRSKGSTIPLDHFKYTPKSPRPHNPPKSLKVGVERGGLKELVGAFVTDINGPKVFERVGKKRLPIKRLYGPSVPQMLKKQGIKETIETQAQEMFEKRLDHEVNRILERG